MRGRLQKVLTSYLNGRMQFVEVNGVLSVTVLILSSVPQGSLLGPLLFLIYSFDFCEELASDAFTFADDAKLLSIRQLLSQPQVLQHDMQLLHRWSENNKLPFNLEKCHVMSFTKTNLQVFIGDHLLTQSTEEKDLGVIITSDLNWNTHILSRCKKGHCVLHMLMRNVSPLASWRTKCDLYKSMVLPVLTYCSPSWSPSKATLTKFEQVQKRATAWILSYDCTYRDRLVFLNLLTLTLNLQVYDLLNFSKIVNGVNDFNWHKCITFKSSISTRSDSAIFVDLPKVKKESSRQNFFFRTARVVNQILAFVNVYTLVGLKQR